MSLVCIWSLNLACQFSWCWDNLLDIHLDIQSACMLIGLELGTSFVTWEGSLIAVLLGTLVGFMIFTVEG